MIYEARHAAGLNYALIAGVLLVSLIGFAAAGIIPTRSGTSPLVGWAIILACFAAAFIFFRRASDRRPQARIDAQGVYSRRQGEAPVPWDRIASVQVIAVGIQRIARFHLEDQGKPFGINTSFYDRGMADLIAAVRHHRPDLVA